jgi:hypothetical protein
MGRLGTPNGGFLGSAVAAHQAQGTSSVVPAAGIGAECLQRDEREWRLCTCAHTRPGPTRGAKRHWPPLLGGFGLRRGVPKTNTCMQMHMPVSSTHYLATAQRSTALTGGCTTWTRYTPGASDSTGKRTCDVSSAATRARRTRATRRRRQPQRGETLPKQPPNAVDAPLRTVRDWCAMR